MVFLQVGSGLRRSVSWRLGMGGSEDGLSVDRVGRGDAAPLAVTSQQEFTATAPFCGKTLKCLLILFRLPS